MHDERASDEGPTDPTNEPTAGDRLNADNPEGAEPTKGAIYVCSLFELPYHAASLTPARIVSIIQPEFQPRRPPGVKRKHHLRIKVHDIVQEYPNLILAEEHHMAELIGFLHAWEPDDGALLIHCYAGISRSTAGALIAHFLRTGNAAQSAQALRDAAPHAKPNRHLIELADRHLACDGGLVDAVDSMPPSTVTLDEAPLTTLPI